MDSEVSRRQELLEKEADKPVKYTDDYRILENTSFYFSASLWKRLP